MQRRQLKGAMEPVTGGRLIFDAKVAALSFGEAVTVFLDGDALEGPDVQHSQDERRFLRLRRSADRRVIMVSYTLRRTGDAGTIRIISARRASRREGAAYDAQD